VLFVTELLQSLGKAHANERKPRRNRSQQSKIDLPSHTASAWQAIGDSRDAECHTRDAAPREPSCASLIHRKQLTMGTTKRTFA
jgi:hypothetical protein